MFTLETKNYKNNGSIVTEVTNLQTDERLWIMRKGNIYSKDKVTVYSEKSFNKWLSNLEANVSEEIKYADTTISLLNLSILFNRFRTGNLDTYRDLSQTTVRFFDADEVEIIDRRFYIDIYQNKGKDVLYKIAKRFDGYNNPDKVVFVNFDDLGYVTVSNNKKRLLSEIGEDPENLQRHICGTIYQRNENPFFDMLIEISETDEIGLEVNGRLEDGFYVIKNV